jgi:sn-glycerol 3-phosphate transport system ATP-binding protein
MLAVSSDLPLGETGTPVTIGFRPEVAAAVSATTPGAIAFTVDLVEELGSGRLARGRLAGNEIVVALSPDTPVRAGAQFALAIPPGSLRAFAADGSRIVECEQPLAAE